MKKRSLLALAAMGAAALAAGPRSADACLTCNVSQLCEPGAQGSSCTSYIEDGRRWCQFTLDCSQTMTMTPLEISPVGTYLARGGERVLDRGMEKQRCNGFVVEHLRIHDARPTSSWTVRI